MADDDSTDVGERVSTDVETTTDLLGNYYRGELDRMTTEQNRVDLTTNWAITLLAALLAYVFSSGDRPHYVLLVGILALGLFHVVETRRYRAYDTWRARVRLLEENLIAPALDPEAGIEHGAWRSELAVDLQQPTLKTPTGEAYARRLRRVYLPLYLVLVASWTVQILLLGTGDPVATAAAPGVPGWLVLGGVATFTVVLLAIAFWPRDRQAKGELRDQERSSDWKEK
ncbi:hypothetical protein BV210_07145 [Halorientalis sp. IM1011]|uniref:DUF2270 domain-containing protein n=1 Tax=Halorientalis sp. IM1011 TaxID=1932360 RepID=UPI00097CD516|nr:DUF2270 domain-containing protein [Halorientalis sp. IM1011]AQL42501.1 hypothetical protein BV210_07145 [Halorientalis sp. IM1011]